MSLTKVGSSNVVLTETELRTIRQLKQDTQKDLERITSDIAKLLNQQLDLLATVKRCDVALAPHKTLPLEVLRAIFIFAGSAPTRIPVCNEGVYAMSHVCSAWRQLILTTPELWSNISIDFSKNFGKNKKTRKIHIAREWLSRAHNHPVSFTIDHMDSGIMKDLITHYPCRELYLSSSYLDNECPRLAEASSATLETLHLHATTLEKLLGKDFTLPALKSLSLSAIDRLNVIHPVAPQLRYLQIQCNATHSQVLDLLRLCVQLKHCELEINLDRKGSSKSSTVAPTTQPVVIPTLQVLKLTFRSDADVPSFLRWLTFPNLSSLSLLFHPSSDSSLLDLPTVSELIVRSDGMPHLQSLTIDETNEPLDLKVLLLDTPSLRQLHVKRGSLDADTMDKLSTGGMGPQLRELFSRHKHDADAVLRMVELRHQKATTDQSNKVAPFSSVKINGVAASTSASVAIRDRLQKLRSLGIDISFSV